MTPCSDKSSVKRLLNVCRVCSFEGEAATYTAKEMLFGWKDPFEYFQCSQCQCLQIREIPKDLDRFYPENYGAYHAAKPLLPGRGLKNAFRIWRNRLFLDGSPLYSLLLEKVSPFYETFPAFLNGIKVNSRTRFLDVGCGDGSLLLKLRSMGFRNLTGLEPFQKEAVKMKSGVKIWKGGLEGFKGRFDIVMLHHVFEHIADPHAALESIHRLLAPNGLCLLRIPTVSSYAWEKYGVNWVQLDAPRHLYLFSTESIEHLAKEHRFTVVKRLCDSTNFQFWGSEQYLQGLPLITNQSEGDGWFNPASPELEAIAQQKIDEAALLNEAGRGDQVLFVMRKVS